LRWLFLAGHFCSKKSGSKTNKINIVARNVSMIVGRFAEYFSLWDATHSCRGDES
jgi:hypothetical protein